MSTGEVLENKISYIRQQLSALKQFQNMAREDIVKDATVKAAVERYLYLVAQACVDLSEAVVAFKKFRKPTTMREALEILGEEHILPADFLSKFINIVGFRNALAHDYGEINWEVVYDALHNKLPQVEEFLSYLEVL